MRLNNVSVLFGLVMALFSLLATAEVLELGASELHGKKDQPEAMTFISRAQVDLSSSLPAWRAQDAIAKEIDRDIFLVPVTD